MDDKLLVLLIMDGVLLLCGVFMSTLQNKFNIPQKPTDTVWELIKYVTSAIVGYQLGVGIVNG